MRSRWTSTWRWSVLFHLISGVTPRLWLRCNVVNPGKMFHSSFIDSPSILSKALYACELTNTFFPYKIWSSVLVHLSKTQNKVWEYVDLCKKQTDNFFIITKIMFPWRIIPVDGIHSTDLLWMSDNHFFRYVEHLFHREIVPCRFDEMPIFWAIVPHGNRCSQCWRPKFPTL